MWMAETKEEAETQLPVISALAQISCMSVSVLLILEGH